jgi:hypothetical protein
VDCCINAHFVPVYAYRYLGSAPKYQVRARPCSPEGDIKVGIIAPSIRAASLLSFESNRLPHESKRREHGATHAILGPQSRGPWLTGQVKGHFYRFELIDRPPLLQLPPFPVVPSGKETHVMATCWADGPDAFLVSLCSLH